MRYFEKARWIRLPWLVSDPDVANLGVSASLKQSSRHLADIPGKYNRLAAGRS